MWTSYLLLGGISLTLTPVQVPNLMGPGFVRTVQTSSFQTLAGERERGADIARELVNCAHT